MDLASIGRESDWRLCRKFAQKFKPHTTRIARQMRASTCFVQASGGTI